MEIKFDPNELGPRINHLVDLHDAWGKTLHILIMSQAAYESEQTEEKIKRLTIAMELLENYMTIGYSDIKYASVINSTAPLSLEEKKMLSLPENTVLPELKEYKPNTEDIS